jgi:hypothetical protein
MKFSNLAQKIFAFAIYIGCLYLFVYLMKDIWEKFTSKLTTIGVRYRGKESELLPCFTVQSYSAFKSNGFYYTEEDIKKNSLKAEDIFDSQTLQNITKNSSLYKLTVFYNIYFGTCFTICYLKKVMALNSQHTV